MRRCGFVRSSGSVFWGGSSYLHLLQQHRQAGSTALRDDELHVTTCHLAALMPAHTWSQASNQITALLTEEPSMCGMHLVRINEANELVLVAMLA